MQYRVIGVIPARYGSSRFPGKPLADIAGKTMIQRVWERASQALCIDKLLVATDDIRIFKTVKKFGGDAVMTPSNIESGSDRAACAVKNIDADIIVNIQGDEPLIEPDEIDQVAGLLTDDRKAVMGTLVKKIKSIEELKSPNTVKVVIDKNKYAIYFSRSPLPFNRDVSDLKDWTAEVNYYKHIGIYSYTKNFLEKYSKWEKSKLESIEKLEQLRVLENGFRIKTAETKYEPVCVDTNEDLDRVRRLFLNSQ